MAGEEEVDGGGAHGGGRSMVPQALTKECLVRAKVEDPEKQRARAEAVRSKSVHELSQVRGIVYVSVLCTYIQCTTYIY